MKMQFHIGMAPQALSGAGAPHLLLVEPGQVAIALLDSICPKTRPEILKVMAWDLEALRKGIRPSHDHLGKPLLRRRAELAGKPFRMKAAFAYWKGDAEARYMAHETWFAEVTQSVLCLLFSFV